MNDVVAAFLEYFEIIDANSPELLREVFRLRYQVLCVEQRAPGFEPSSYPDGLESDQYDRHSSHILLRHRPSSELVGTARLILPDPRDTMRLLPTEKHTEIDPALLDTSRLPRQNLGEISRLVVIRRFARRKNELLYTLKHGMNVDKWAPSNQRRFPHPILALVVGIIRMSAQHNITQYLSVMEPSLNRLLGLFGLQFQPVGPLIDHHGLRRPYYMDLISLLDSMYITHREFWELMTDFGNIRIGSTNQFAQASAGN